MPCDTSHLKPLTALYVDDDRGTWSLIERALKRRLREVHFAADGAEGLEIVKTRTPSFVITDIQMPVMDGLTMIEKIRALPLERRPIIVISAFNDPEHHSPLADAHLYKPLDLEVLFQTLADLALRYFPHASDAAPD